MPPVLNIAFLKLSSGTEQEVFADKLRLAVDERHRILQLIAEAEGASRLIVSAPRPETACERLIHQPAVCQYVERLVRGLHMHRAKCVPPILPDHFERAARRSRPTKAAHQVSGIFDVPPNPEPENDLALLPTGQLEWHMDCAAGIEPSPHFARQPHPGHRSRTTKRAIAPNKLRPVATDGPRRLVHVKEGSPAGEFRMIGISCEKGAALGVQFGHDMHRGFWS